MLHLSLGMMEGAVIQGKLILATVVAGATPF